jgi:putative oxidoreductase
MMQTEPDYTLLFIRVISGIIIFPYGMQKLFGWFDDFGGGVGVIETLAEPRKRPFTRVCQCISLIRER